MGTFWPLSRNFACSEQSRVYIYIYIHIPGDPKSKLAGEKRFNERRKPSPPLFGNKDDERRVEKVRIKGMLILLRRKFFFFFFFIYIYSRQKLMELVYEFSEFMGTYSGNRIYSATIKIQC